MGPSNFQCSCILVLWWLQRGKSLVFEDFFTFAHWIWKDWFRDQRTADGLRIDSCNFKCLCILVLRWLQRSKSLVFQGFFMQLMGNLETNHCWSLNRPLQFPMFLYTSTTVATARQKPGFSKAFSCSSLQWVSSSSSLQQPSAPHWSFSRKNRPKNIKRTSNSKGGLISESFLTLAHISKNMCQITVLSIFSVNSAKKSYLLPYFGDLIKVKIWD